MQISFPRYLTFLLQLSWDVWPVVTLTCVSQKACLVLLPNGTGCLRTFQPQTLYTAAGLCLPPRPPPLLLSPHQPRLNKVRLMGSFSLAGRAQGRGMSRDLLTSAGLACGDLLPAPLSLTELASSEVTWVLCIQPFGQKEANAFC